MGDDSPSSVGSFLIWQQPHIIYMAELCYLNTNSKVFLEQYAPLIFKTAEFMASYAHFDSISKKYMLGPLLIPAQESLPFSTTINPPFELAYWYWGLSTAQKWRERLGMERNTLWDAIIKGLPSLSQKNGLYLAAESAGDTYVNPRYTKDHPMVLGALGVLPACPLVNKATMINTFNHIWDHWHWNDTWGWDFPMVAMSATRLGMPERAIDALFMPVKTNTYLPNGHNYQNERLRLYLPGNGALLTAIALMCAGEKGSDENMPGFPKDGSWKVKWEGFSKMP